jgi:hypothetical protein
MTHDKRLATVASIWSRLVYWRGRGRGTHYSRIGDHVSRSSISWLNRYRRTLATEIRHQYCTISPSGHRCNSRSENREKTALLNDIKRRPVSYFNNAWVQQLVLSRKTSSKSTQYIMKIFFAQQKTYRFRMIFRCIRHHKCRHSHWRHPDIRRWGKVAIHIRQYL